MERMGRIRERALELADIIASTEGLSSSKVLDEAKKELDEYLKKLDPQTQKEVMERIRGFS
jgi:hypothetical protein